MRKLKNLVCLFGCLFLLAISMYNANKDKYDHATYDMLVALIAFYLGDGYK